MRKAYGISTYCTEESGAKGSEIIGNKRVNCPLRTGVGFEITLSVHCNVERAEYRTKKLRVGIVHFS